jgi:hypothetical protein
MKVTTFRFAVFGIWVVSLLAVVGSFLISMVYHGMPFSEAQEGLESVAALILPQITIMCAFFFGASEVRQRRILERDRGIAWLAVILSLVYHVAFWLLLVAAIVFGRLEPTIGKNATALVKIMGLLSILGLTPVAYLFAKGADAGVPAEPGGG